MKKPVQMAIELGVIHINTGTWSRKKGQCPCCGKDGKVYDMTATLNEKVTQYGYTSNRAICLEWCKLCLNSASKYFNKKDAMNQIKSAKVGDAATLGEYGTLVPGLVIAVTKDSVTVVRADVKPEFRGRGQFGEASRYESSELTPYPYSFGEVFKATSAGLRSQTHEVASIGYAVKYYDPHI
jgi:hypothetical protein